MTDWLLETLIWTAILITAVLALRRPVARWFGPQVAYALWVVPALRLVFPPIELPAWMRPDEAAQTAPTTALATGQSEFQFVPLDPTIPVATTDGPVGVEAAASGVSGPVTPVLSLEFGPFIELGIAAWLIGAAIFLYMRFSAYFQLRTELLEDGHDVGRDGKVRLIETPGTDAPIAFGVIDKVIALPMGFLAQPDRIARDLALAHEMAHHDGRDLLINVAIQPLFALHWFNPLGRYGWLALRRDQEAACDARVLAAKPAKEREAYANLIVSFAAGPNVSPNLALAAPMACPVLGEKSIIHRLRSLKMTDTSNSRRLTGRLILGAVVIALPLTASISYAASDAPAPLVPPEIGMTSPTPPAPPAPPLPPVAATATILSVDPDTSETPELTSETVYTSISDENQDEERVERRVESIYVSDDGEPMSEAQMEEIMIEVRQGLEEANLALEAVPAQIEAALASAEGLEGRTIVKMECDNSSDEVATTTEDSDGIRTVMICQTRVMAHALEGLREAREEIANSREMSAEMRARIVRELDQQIDHWADRQS